MTYDAEVIADTPLVYWRLDALSGTTEVDTSENAHDGTYNGAVTLGEPDLVGDVTDTAARFDGTSDDQYVKSNDDLGNTTYPAFTLEAVFSLDPGTTQGTIAQLVDDSSFLHTAAIYQAVGTNQVYVDFYNDNGGSPFYLTSVLLTVADSTPTHVVLTYDGTTANVYQDGTLIDSEGPTGGSGDFDLTGVAAHLYVGGDEFAVGDGFFGVIDEVAFYDSALSAVRVLAHAVAGGFAAPSSAYSTEVLADAPTVYLRLDETSGTVAADSSGNGNDWTYSVDASTLTSPSLLTGDSDLAVTITNPTNVVASPVSPSYLPDTGLAAYTIELIVNISEFPISSNQLAGSDPGHPYFQISPTGLLTFFGTVANCTGPTLALNTTYHLCATYDGADVVLYVDGTAVDTQAQTGLDGVDTGQFYEIGYSFGNEVIFTADEFAFYGYDIGAGRVAAHFLAMGGGGGGDEDVTDSDTFTLTDDASLATYGLSGTGTGDTSTATRYPITTESPDSRGILTESGLVLLTEGLIPSIASSLFFSFYYFDEFGTGISAVERRDAAAPYTLRERYQFESPYSVSQDDPFRLYEIRRWNNLLYTLAKSNGAQDYDGAPGFVPSDYWALVRWNPAALTDKTVLGLAEGMNSGTSGNMRDKESLRIVAGVAYIAHMGVDPGTNVELTAPTHFATRSWSVDGGAPIAQYDHGARSDEFFSTQRPFAFALDNTHTYTVGEIDVFTDPTDERKIYYGDLTDPFNAVWFDGTALVGEVWAVGAVNPDNGHVFCWVADPSGTFDLLSEDSFNRSNGAIGTTDGSGLSDPQGWVAQTGTWNINTNQAQASALGAGPSRAIATLDLGRSDVDLEITHAASDVNGRSIIFRYVDASNYLLLIGDTSTLHISKVEAGVLTSLSGNLGGVVAGSVVRVVASGDAITAYLDGVAVGSVTSSFNQTATLHGLGSQGTGQRFDNWRAIAAAPPTHPAFWFLVELATDGSIVQSFDVVTSLFTIDNGSTIPGVIEVFGGKVYTTIYLTDGSHTPAGEIADGVWVIDIATGAGVGDPAFQLGETFFGGDSFDFNIIRGICYYEGSATGVVGGGGGTDGGGGGGVTGGGGSGGGGGGMDAGSSLPPAGGYLPLEAVGFLPRSDAAAAALVHVSTWEPRLDNYTANHTVPGSTTLGNFSDFDDEWNATYKTRITGNYTGTTDSIVQWACAKWGWSDELLRAEMIQESDWHQDSLGDYEPASGGHRVYDRFDDPTPTSFSIIQNKWYYHPDGVLSNSPLSSYPRMLLSTAFALDIFCAMMRGVYNGHSSYLNGGGMAAAGDEWGAIGYWFSGGWHDSEANGYISDVMGHLAAKVWLDGGF